MAIQTIKGVAARIKHRVVRGNTETYLMIQASPDVYLVNPTIQDGESFKPNKDLFMTQEGDIVSFDVHAFSCLAYNFKNVSLSSGPGT